MNRNSGDLEVGVGAGDEGESVGFADACLNIALPSRPSSPHISRSACSPRPVGERRGRDAGGRARPRYGLTSRRLNPKARSPWTTTPGRHPAGQHRSPLSLSAIGHQEEGDGVSGDSAVNRGSRARFDGCLVVRHAKDEPGTTANAYLVGDIDASCDVGIKVPRYHRCDSRNDEDRVAGIDVRWSSGRTGQVPPVDDVLAEENPALSGKAHPRPAKEGNAMVTRKVRGPVEVAIGFLD